MALELKKATKAESKLRMALMGPSGSGKTYTGLSLAFGLGQKVVVIDTERGSAEKYSDRFQEYFTITLDRFAPSLFIEAIEIAEKAGADVIIIDSFSHAWTGKDGILEMHDTAMKRNSNSFAAWRDVTPKHNELVDRILRSPSHVIVTMRSKTDYVQEKDEKGRTTIKRVGMAPVQKDGVEYEFDVIADLNLENDFIVGKTRCSALAGKVYNRAGENVAEVLRVWLQGEKLKPTTFPKAVPELPTHTGTEAMIEKPATRTDELAAQREDDSTKLIGEIKSMLGWMNKDEAAFNRWAQNEYSFDQEWTAFGVAILRELKIKVEGWMSAAKAAKTAA